MRNYKSIPQLLCLLAAIVAGSIALHSCVTSHTYHFKDSYLFRNSFYSGSFCIECPPNDSLSDTSILTPFYCGFNENYVVNNDIFVSSMTRPSYRHSQIGHATAEVDKYHEKQLPPKDSQEIFILRLNKTFSNKDAGIPENYMFDTVNTYYLYVSLKYSQFKENADSPRKYAVCGYGHVYLGEEDTATGNLLFRSELKIVHYHNPEKPGKGKNDYVLAKKKNGNLLLLFESRRYKKRYGDTSARVVTAKNGTEEIRSDANNVSVEHSHVDSLEPYHLYSVPAGRELNFSYIIVGNYNQIGGRKYLDISVDSIFHYEALRFGPYPPKAYENKGKKVND